MTRIVLIAAWLAALTLGIAGRAWLPANADVSWLLTVAEKWLDGGRLYIDMLENNPPMAVFLYAPEVWLGRALSIPPERMVDIFVFGLGALSILWAGARLPQDVADAGPARSFLAPAAFAVIAIMPAFTFGEREHFALIFFLPWLAIAIRRAHGAPVHMVDCLVAGVAGGLVVSIKPHFALAIVATSVAASIQIRSWRPFFALENWIAGALVAAYLVLALALYPAYWNDLLPTLTLLYVPVRIPVWSMLFGAFPVFALELAVIGALLIRSRGKPMFEPWVMATLAAIAGFLAAAIIQGKGWTYHFYPALALIALLLAALGARRPSTQRPDALVLTAALALFAQAWNWGTIGLHLREMPAKVAALGPHPRLVSLATDLSVGFPAVREIGGVWVDRNFARWIPLYASGIASRDGFDPARLPALRAAVEKDLRGLAEDIRHNLPDGLLVERRGFDMLARARRDSELAGLLACYHPVERLIVGDPDKHGEGMDVEIWGAIDRPTLGACIAASRRAADTPPP